MATAARIPLCSVTAWLLLPGLLLASHPRWAAAFPQGCYPSEEEGLKTFRCSSARLTEVPRDIPNDTNKLYLDSNRIPFLPRDAFRDLPLLLELDLSHNAITSIESGAFLGLAEHLRSLDLSSNNLVSVSKDTFSNLKAKVNLSNNPWLCDCRLQELIRTLELAPGSSGGLVCNSSVQEEHVGKAFLQVMADTDLCNAYKKTTDVAMLVTMFGWFTMVISYLVYYVRQNQEDARRHLEYLKSLPSKQRRSEESSTISTVV
ncbi:leucine-rich repeat-containing protein 3C [Neopsephotus bourkii]|uniref:leucine-rich repeat-containing protein 3C n=1 Tax=Neopsephotus bourkii TaxID=309878 RepID=UPI002AA55B23|nr:leucine-rich repeat-containing protein 3C [Neopsephotus bourkii]XP_061231296.1 leucine-rich repeat-containing protein 3C [Neopsephotus bourkii]